MAYTVNHQNADNTLAGFVVALPFKFENNLLVLMPDRAFAVLNLVEAHSPRAAYPALSKALAGTDSFQIRDENKWPHIDLKDFIPVQVLSSQSTDLASSHWVLGGSASTTCQIDFKGGVKSPFPNFLADHHEHFYWGGQIKDKSKTHLNLSYLEINHDVMRKSLVSILCLGPSGSKGAGSIFNRIIEQGAWMVHKGGRDVYGVSSFLSELEIEDQRRNARAVLFGQSAQAAAQVSRAAGAVFLSHGSYNRLAPVELDRLVRYCTTDRKNLKEIAGRLWLHPTNQSVARTTGDYAYNVNTEENSVFEGLTVWDLEPRQDGGQLQAKVPFLL